MQAQPAEKNTRTIFSKGRIVALAIIVLALVGCLAFTWITRDAMTQLNFLRQHRKESGALAGQKAVVSIAAWQTAQTLSALAASAEEQDLARNAERLADHDVDQAFALALRLTAARVRHATLSDEAKDFTQSVTELEQTVKQDRQQVRHLGGDPDEKDSDKKKPEAVNADENDDLDLARTQLSLDSGELDDARKDLARATGDNSEEIEHELNAYLLTQQKAQTAAPADAQHAVAVAKQRRTLLMRIQSWLRQRDRSQLLMQASAQASAEQAALTAARAETQKKLQTLFAAASPNRARILQLKDQNSLRQILSIYDDRIETDKQLAAVYNKWTAQIGVQHRILLHMIVVSLAWIFVVILAVIAADMLAQKALLGSTLDPRYAQTLHRITRLCLQIVGVVAILLVVFGVPQQTSTVLGLLTAALTIALQDFILAFLGWFLLMGPSGVHAGDWVEINGVSGEVVEVGLIKTTLIELGGAAGKGHPTGRRISFVNSYAIRGQYFNFSTSVRWMWDEVSIEVPKTLDVLQLSEEIEQLVREKTEENARAAERDWKRVARNSTLANLAAASTLSMRPTVQGIEVIVHYITRANERFAMRDQLYLQLLGLLQSKMSSH